MKRLTHLMTYLFIISNLVLMWSCSNVDNAARQDDTPVRIGIAWRGDSTAITFPFAGQDIAKLLDGLPCSCKAG